MILRIRRVLWIFYLENIYIYKIRMIFEDNYGFFNEIGL